MTWDPSRERRDDIVYNPLRAALPKLCLMIREGMELSLSQVLGEEIAPHAIRPTMCRDCVCNPGSVVEECSLHVRCSPMDRSVWMSCSIDSMNACVVSS